MSMITKEAEITTFNGQSVGPFKYSYSWEQPTFVPDDKKPDEAQLLKWYQREVQQAANSIARAKCLAENGLKAPSAEEKRIALLQTDEGAIADMAETLFIHGKGKITKEEATAQARQLLS